MEPMLTRSAHYGRGLTGSLLLAAAIALLAVQVRAQEVDTTAAPVPATAPPAQSEPATPSRVYFGGTVGASFGDYFRITVRPMVGYKLSPKASLGLRVGYEYVSYSGGVTTQTYHNYGASLFARYFLIPQLYAHGEFAYYSYGFSTGSDSDDRDWVPFLLLGAGVRQPLGGGSAAFIIEVLFDVINDENSPYESGSPFISIGVAFGL